MDSKTTEESAGDGDELLDPQNMNPSTLSAELNDVAESDKVPYTVPTAKGVTDFILNQHSYTHTHTLSHRTRFKRGST